MSEPTIRYASVCSGVEAASLAWEKLDWKPVWFSEVEPFPCKVLAERFGASSPVNPLDPEDASDEKDRKERANWLKAIRREKMPSVTEAKVPNLGDMSKINGKEYHGTIDLLVGGTPCFVAGTMVLTPSGYQPIESLKIGNPVVTHTGEVRNITAIGNKEAKTGEVKILGRPSIRCTGNHPFYSIATKRDNRRNSSTYGQKIHDGEYEFHAIEDSVGRYAGRIVAKQAEWHIPNVYKATQDEIMELAGWYLGDGYIRRWTGKNKKAVIIAAVCQRKIDQFCEIFNGVIQYSVAKDGKITITNTVLANWLIENFGEKSQSKKLPYWIYTCKLKNRFIAGYEKTDGSHRANGNVRISTTSPALAYGVADLYGNASVDSCKREATHIIEGRKVSQRDTYTIYKAKRKTARTKMLCGRYASIIRGWNNDGAIRTVYNITVDGEHSYIANGIAVHNCQGFSIAGTQKGLDDPRSALALKYVELLGSARPRWFVWENVPNAFSCNGGGDVKEFFRQITEIGYGVCWRVLDAEYVRVDGFPGAVPQRRRRIFAVGYLGDWRPAAKVLFESKMLCGDSAPRRLKGKATPGDTEKRTGESNALDANAGTADAVRNTVETGKGFYRESDVGGTLEAHEDQHRRNIICIENGQSAAASAVNKSTTLSCDHEAPIIVFHGSQDPISNPDHANAVNRNQGMENCVCFEPGILKREEDGGDGDPMNTLSTVHVPGVAYEAIPDQQTAPMEDQTILLKNIGWIVRRITPLEAERLMGFPDCHTMIPWNGKAAAECPDAPRYKACGNSMCVNAMRWLGERIDAVEKSIQAGTFDQLFDAEDLELEGDETEMDEDAEAEYMVILEDQAKEILRLKQENEQLRHTVAAYQQKENAK